MACFNAFEELQARAIFKAVSSSSCLRIWLTVNSCRRPVNSAYTFRHYEPFAPLRLLLGSKASKPRTDYSLTDPRRSLRCQRCTMDDLGGLVALQGSLSPSLRVARGNDQRFRSQHQLPRIHESNHSNFSFDARRAPYHTVAPTAIKLRWMDIACVREKVRFFFRISSLISASLYLVPSRVSAEA